MNDLHYTCIPPPHAPLRAHLLGWTHKFDFAPPRRERASRRRMRGESDIRLAVFDVGGTAIKYAAMTDGEMDGKGEVPTPATCSGDFLAAIEGVLDALRAEGDIEGVALSQLNLNHPRFR